MTASSDHATVSPATLTPWPRNARTHSKKQIRQIVASIRQFGFTVPVLIDEAETILAGHGRVAAATVLGLTTVPCLQLTHLSEAQKRAYVLADNKLALNAGWDEDLLAKELGALLATDLDLDIGVTGFSIPEVDTLLATVRPRGVWRSGRRRPPGHGPRPGPPGRGLATRGAPAHLWRCARPRRARHPDGGRAGPPGLHRSALQRADRRACRRLGPHHAPRVRHGRRGDEPRGVHRVSAAGPRAAGRAQCRGVDSTTSAWTGRHLPEILAAGEAVFTELKNLVVWVKDNGGMGTFYRSRHELILVFKHGTAPHCNTFELGQHGRYRTNVWEYRGVNTRRAGRMADLALHPTVKPVQLIADALRDVSGRGEIVLDGFRRIWLDPDRPRKRLAAGRACAKSTPSIVTASSRAGKPMPRTTPRGWRPRGPRPPTARRWRHEPRPPAAPPDRRVRSPARGASLHARPVRQSERPPKGHHVPKNLPRRLIRWRRSCSTKPRA